MRATENDDRRAWHFGKEIPIALLVGLAIQAGGVLWYVSGWMRDLSKDVQALAYRVNILEDQLKITNKSVTDTIAPTAVVSLRLDVFGGQLAELKARLDYAEKRDRK